MLMICAQRRSVFFPDHSLAGLPCLHLKHIIPMKVKDVPVCLTGEKTAEAFLEQKTPISAQHLRPVRFTSTIRPSLSSVKYPTGAKS